MNGKFRPLADPTLIERLKAASIVHLSRDDYQEPTYKCLECKDVAFTTRVDSRGRVYGSPCVCLLDDRANKIKASAIRFRGKDREKPIDADEGIPF